MKLRKKRKSIRPKSKLGLPDLEHAKAAVVGSLPSAGSKREYGRSIDEFVAWYCAECQTVCSEMRSPQVFPAGQTHRNIFHVDTPLSVHHPSICSFTQSGTAHSASKWPVSASAPHRSANTPLHKSKGWPGEGNCWESLSGGGGPEGCYGEW